MTSERLDICWFRDPTHVNFIIALLIFIRVNQSEFTNLARMRIYKREIFYYDTYKRQ